MNDSNYIKYRNYTIYGRFSNNVCGRRCKTIVSNKLFQKCVCKSNDTKLTNIKSNDTKSTNIK